MPIWEWHRWFNYEVVHMVITGSTSQKRSSGKSSKSGGMEQEASMSEMAPVQEVRVQVQAEP
jgi:hypothetical protein